MTLSNIMLFFLLLFLDCSRISAGCIECANESTTGCLRCDVGYFLDSGACTGIQQTSYTCYMTIV